MTVLITVDIFLAMKKTKERVIIMARKNIKFITIRIDEELHKDFMLFCENCELTVSGAVGMFVKETIREGKLPFQVFGDIPLDKSTRGLAKPSTRISVRIDGDDKDKFADVCESIGVPVGRAIKIFMRLCVNKGALPF